MPGPVIFVVDEDEKSLREIERELSDRYDILALGSRFAHGTAWTF